MEVEGQIPAHGYLRQPLVSILSKEKMGFDPLCTADRFYVNDGRDMTMADEEIRTISNTWTNCASNT